MIGTERHESRRIDNQLRGRSGRQGDPGSSRFYLSLEDDLMRIFASERVSSLMQKLGMQEGEAIEHPWVTKAIENAQRKVEGRNFDIRKQLLEYDDVANDQRKVIYRQRRRADGRRRASSDTVNAMRDDVLDQPDRRHIPPESLEEQWDVPAWRGPDGDLRRRLAHPPVAGRRTHDLHEETAAARASYETRRQRMRTRRRRSAPRSCARSKRR